MTEIAKAYNPKECEDKWYSQWEAEGIFHSEVDESKTPYTIVIPPPNITGSLTMGHILNNTLQDIFIRYKRMKGFNACWVPGTDHASIATESKVIKMLKEQGIDKYSIGREKYLEHCHAWKEKYGGIITRQLRKLGVSCDWERERFTMDEHYYSKVIEAFVQLHSEGKIYRGFRIVNWCPVSKSAISNEEVIPRQVNGYLWHFRYPVVGSSEYIVVATTRPETMLGDTAVAVNPHDERYTSLIGKTVLLPIVDREIPIIADSYVDQSFGTGAVKVTPAHDPNDYEMGVRHNLEMINIFNEDATLNHNAPQEFQGLDRYEARKKVVARFQEFGLLEKTEPYTHNVGYSERGNVPIEPYLSEQWFMKMEELSKPALDAVLNGKIKFYPSHWVKTYEHWMSNIKDWCISRQLWWGHRIPVWYCNNESNEECKKPIVRTVAPEVCPYCGSKELRQDEDVLDTWASSWLWAHEVFKTEKELKYYYPTDTLVTGPDIIFFWVARMIMAGLHFKGDIPFRNVYFTSIIRDIQGRKMSKSLGNSPDPLDVIDNYGADALRFTVIYLAPLGQDVLFSEEKCEIGRNFANKIWNAGRFLIMNMKDITPDLSLANAHRDVVDDWIESRLNSTIKQCDEMLAHFEINSAIKALYTFVWNDFCDWYLELIKNRLYSENLSLKTATLTRAVIIFEKMLKMVHPYMPFITEELWHLIAERPKTDSISKSDYPVLTETAIREDVEKEMELLQDIITAIRNIRGEMNIPPSKTVNVYVKSEDLNTGYVDYLKKLAKVESVTIDKNLIKPAKSASAVVRSIEIYVPLEGLIDLEVEKNRLNKEIQRLLGSLESVRKKLANGNFVANAPVDVVERERQKARDWEDKYTKLQEILNNLN